MWLFALPERTLLRHRHKMFNQLKKKKLEEQGMLQQAGLQPTAPPVCIWTSIVEL